LIRGNIGTIAYVTTELGEVYKELANTMQT
jgi:hypothetical protein